MLASVNFRISPFDDPIRAFLDAPYLDGIENIKEALDLGKIQSYRGNYTRKSSRIVKV
jgi:hypothetical protein